jgi:uncharacterized protein with LGFP repeats
MPLPNQYLVNPFVDQGVDYAAPGGTPECAMGDGTIIGEGGPGLGGFGPNAPILRIDDGPLAGRAVYYGHSGPDLVPVGAHVASGQQITSVGFGIVGLSTGPHLEVGFYNLNTMSPGPNGAGQEMLNYINSAGHGDSSSCSIWAGHAVCGAIRDKYLALGGAYTLGWPTTDETGTPDGIGRYNYFTNHAAIYWTPSTGAWSIHGDILDKWAGTGWETGYLGYPIDDETTTPDTIGRYNYFDKHGAIYWTPGTGAQAIHGAILDKWASLGWETSFLGYPTQDEATTPNQIGRFNYFSNHGAIYWTGPTGAWSIHGAILDKWASLGWENSFLGFPTTDETTTPNGIGRYNYFSLGGAIYWTGSAGAWSIHGAILDKWASLGWENSFLGFPVTDETGTPDGIGRFNHFSSTADPNNQDGSIYWTPNTAAWSVHGAIRTKWASMGWERSCLGYPVSDEFAITGGRQSNFQAGNIAFLFNSGLATSSC